VLKALEGAGTKPSRLRGAPFGIALAIRKIMLSIILIAFISLISLLVLHELGHFIMAKKFGVEVQEFGIGYPPRLIGKKIKDTIYSLNLLPFGAFIKIDEKELKQKPIWQRAIILIAGIVSFWIISIILISIILSAGAPIQVLDEENEGLINPKVQIIAVAPDSPANIAGLEIGDIISGLRISDYELQVDKVGQVQEFADKYKGQEIILNIERGQDVLEVKLAPRVLPPSGQGAMGVGLARIAIKKYSFLQAIPRAVLSTFRMTWQIVLGFFEMFKNLILRKPIQAELVGPIGIFDIFVQAGNLGAVYFLQTLVLISLHIAVVNALPIPAADGGRLLFLGIEKIRKKPLSEKIEQRINIVFFVLLIMLMILVTIKDISRIF